MKASPFSLDNTMELIVEGPEKAGKTTLVNMVLKGFKPTHCGIVKISGPEKYELSEQDKRIILNINDSPAKESN